MEGKVLPIDSHPKFRKGKLVYNGKGVQLRQEGSGNYSGKINIRTRAEPDMKLATAAAMRFLLRQRSIPNSLLPSISLRRLKFPKWYPVSSDYHYFEIKARYKSPKDSDGVKLFLDRIAKSVKRALYERAKTKAAEDSMRK